MYYFLMYFRGTPPPRNTFLSSHSSKSSVESTSHSMHIGDACVLSSQPNQLSRLGCCWPAIVPIACPVAGERVLPPQRMRIRHLSQQCCQMGLDSAGRPRPSWLSAACPGGPFPYGGRTVPRRPPGQECCWVWFMIAWSHC